MFKAALVAGVLACSAGSSFALTVVKGQVEFVRTHDANLFPGWAPPRFWFTLKGVTQAGSCLKWVSGTVMFVSNDKQALTMVMAAQMSGLEVAVAFDDQNVTNGYCTAYHLTTGNPAPLN